MRFDWRLGVSRAAPVLAAFLVALAVTETTSESLTLTTYYPAPSGVYAQMITTGNTYLARDGGAVSVGTQLSSSTLTVNGSIRLGDSAAECSEAAAGTQRWHAGALQICDGKAWAGPSGMPTVSPALSQDSHTFAYYTSGFTICPAAGGALTSVEQRSAVGGSWSRCAEVGAGMSPDCWYCAMGTVDEGGRWHGTFDKIRASAGGTTYSW